MEYLEMLKELRKHMKKKEISKELKVSLTTIDRWEDENSKPNADNLKKINALYKRIEEE